MTVKTALKSAQPTPKVAAQTTAATITGLITWLLVTTYWKSGLPIDVAVALPTIVAVVWGFASGWLKKENIVIPPLAAPTPAVRDGLTALVHTPEWLADVRQLGPNGRSFWKPGEDAGLPIPAFVTGNGQMEDDVTTGEFTPGCEAYAGYSTGSFANMTAVRAYAAGQNARSFAYSGNVNALSGANAIDMEPGLASTSDAAAAYRAGIRYFYCSASSVSAVVSNLSAAGIPRPRYKVVSAHYSGEHICGPSTCGYPQADATQWTDTYLGRSLDSTVMNATFWGSTPPKPPAPFYGAPRNVVVDVVTPSTQAFTLMWSAPAPVSGVPVPTAYEVFVYENTADEAHILTGYPTTVPASDASLKVEGLAHGNRYIVHIVAAGDTKYIGKDVFATTVLTP